MHESRHLRRRQHRRPEPRPPPAPRDPGPRRAPRLGDRRNLTRCHQRRQGQPIRAEPAYGRCQGKEIRLPGGLEVGPLWAIPCGLPEQHSLPGGPRSPLYRRHPGPRYRYPEPRLAVLTPRSGRGRGVRKVADPGAHPGGRLRYQQDYNAGKVGKTVYSRSGKNLPVGRPRRIFNRERVAQMRRSGASIRAIARGLGAGVGTVRRTLLESSKTC